MLNALTTENIFRKCSIQKKIFPRSELFRVVRTKQGNIFFDPEYAIFGRGIHFVKDEKTIQNFFDPRKRGMISHFLKTSISQEKFEILQKEVEKYRKNFRENNK